MHAPSTAPHAESARGAGQLTTWPGSYVTLHLSETPEVGGDLGQTQSRLGASLGFSVLAHVVGVTLALVVVLSMPAVSPPTQSVIERGMYEIVWLPQEGPGGGGGGGGNRSLEPPRRLEMPGRDRISLPVAKPVTVEPPKPQDPPKDVETPPVELSLPAVAMASGTETIVGTMDGIPDPTSTSQGSGTGGGAGTGRGTGIGPGTGSGLGPGYGGGTGGGVYRPGSGITIPRVIREVKPQYTPDALRAKIQGEVWLDCVVLPTGDVGHCEITRSLDSVFGLDQEALKAAKQWRFVPGTKQGVPVPVLVTISMGFTLR